MGSGDLTRLFAPRSVAMLGASSSDEKPGGPVFARLTTLFDGKLAATNPVAPTIPAIAALPSMAFLTSAAQSICRFWIASPILLTIRGPMPSSCMSSRCVIAPASFAGRPSHQLSDRQLNEAMDERSRQHGQQCCRDA